jgi:biotin transport system substrate-specific component
MNPTLKYSVSKTFIQKIFLTITFSLLTAFATRVFIPLPFTPIPITLQTFVVLLSGLMLGKWWGGLSQLLFVVFRLFEVPLCGPTGGYLIGFILTALFLGFASSFAKKFKYSFVYIVVVTLVSLVCYYIPGLLHLGFLMTFVQHQTPTLSSLLSMGFLPFIVGDLIKAVSAAIFHSNVSSIIKKR